ncbi:hypothetical protein PUNSTDRAFT_42456 [Punctularia strigosozonata HHB-11173 SS5]|uniref:uncharacterized protein n=1 Tax=Punctularia strigosozonata (strain HHB-11173) TaxID=741275 RepID=UPI000441732D|nr:uncharacterized protein PUNSTDRAFT_42456 [Punctularia strigosozonata HHB-11173 SS5]EIN13043.1 hypothetical protein PUNSTDRAFT_42456 [Punctularia strigosozonata HHB-11173 SS5]
MGSCFSSCRRRVRRSEREPLLPKNPDNPSSDILPPPRSHLQQLGDVLAALSAGKMPSQEQIDQALRALLNTDLLNAHAGKAVAASGTAYGSLASAAGGLSPHGKLLLDDANDIVQALLSLGMQKNADDKIQDLLYQARRIDSPPLEADLAVDASAEAVAAAQAIASAMPEPTQIATDARALVDSTLTLSRMFLTSSTFRAVFSDVSTFLRERLGDAAVAVGNAALDVAGVAEAVDDVAKKVERVASVVEDVAEDVVNIAHDAEEEVREAGTGPEDLPVKAKEMEEAAGGAQARADDVLHRTRDEARRTREELAEDARRLGEDLGTMKANVETETQERWRDMKQEAPDRMKEVVIQRILEVRYVQTNVFLDLTRSAHVQTLIQVQRVPSYRAALQTIVALFSEYAQKISALTSVVADVQTTNPSPAETGLKGTDPFADPPTTTAPESHTDPNPPVPSSSAPPVTVIPIIWTDPHLDAALADLKIILERLASGRSLDRLLSLVERLTKSIATTPAELIQVDDVANPFSQARDWFAAARRYVTAAIDDPQYAASRVGTRTAEELYDRASDILAISLQGDTEFGRTLRELWSELDAFAHAISSDAAIARLVRALGSLSVHLAAFSPTAEATHAALRIRKQVQHDLLVWVLPRLLRLLTTFPMPRVEFTSPSLDAAVDAVMVTARSFGASLIPDRVKVENWSEVDLDLAQSVSKAKNRVRLHVDGLRVSARDIAYYARYKGPAILGYEDEGLLSIDIGGSGPDAVGEGLRASVDLEMDADWASSELINESEEAGPSPLFHVNAVKVDVPGMHFAIDRSKHWIINKGILQPLAGPMARFAVGWVLQSQIKNALEAFARVGGSVQKDAVSGASEGQPGIWDYWRALSAHYAGSSASHQDEEEDETQEQTTSYTTATMKGIIHTTQSLPKDGASSSQPSSAAETTIAVGIGAQVLPGKGGPHDHDAHEPDPEPARRVLDQVESEVVGKVQKTEGVVENTRHDIDVAQARKQVRERLERKRSGWRSAAFDI